MNDFVRRGFMMLEQLISLLLVVTMLSWTVTEILNGIKDVINLPPYEQEVGLLALVNIMAHFISDYTDGIYKMTSSILERIYRTTIVATVRNIYLYGPMLRGYGFWAGKSIEDICAQLTSADAAIWLQPQNMHECVKLIDKEVQSYVIVLQMILFFILIVKYINHFYEKFIKTRPSTKTMLIPTREAELISTPSELGGQMS